MLEARPPDSGRASSPPHPSLSLHVCMLACPTEVPRASGRDAAPFSLHDTGPAIELPLNRLKGRRQHRRVGMLPELGLSSRMGLGWLWSPPPSSATRSSTPVLTIRQLHRRQGRQGYLRLPACRADDRRHLLGRKLTVRRNPAQRSRRSEAFRTCRQRGGRSDS